MSIRRFKEQPIHRRLLEKAVQVLKGDDRVKGLYLSGMPSTDEYSDIDLFILSSLEDREGPERDRLKTASRVGQIMAEAMSTVPHTYVVVYEPGVKMDYCYHVLPEKPRPDRRFVDVLYDPSGHIDEVVEMSKTASIDVTDEYLPEPRQTLLRSPALRDNEARPRGTLGVEGHRGVLSGSPDIIRAYS